MKYAVIVTETCPEGGIVGRAAWLAESEAEMQAMVDACKNKCSYMGTRVMPLETPNPWVKDKIAECMPNSANHVTSGAGIKPTSQHAGEPAKGAENEG